MENNESWFLNFYNLVDYEINYNCIDDPIRPYNYCESVDDLKRMGNFDYERIDKEQSYEKIYKFIMFDLTYDNCNHIVCFKKLYNILTQNGKSKDDILTLLVDSYQKNATTSTLQLFNSLLISKRTQNYEEVLFQTQKFLKCHFNLIIEMLNLSS